MGTIFFYRKNSCHIGQSYVILIFQPDTQKIQVLLLRFHIMLIFSKQAIPLINEDHKRMLQSSVNILHGKYKIFRLYIFRIFLL